jgi:glycosyltransferase involved in cell wall biosynthesis
MRISQVTYHYKPIVGGQEVLTQSLVGVLEKLGYEQRVYQSDWGYCDQAVITVPKLPRYLSYGALDQYVFQVRLLASHYRELQQSDLIIVHYAMYYPLIAWHPKVIVLSHGTIWNTPTRKINHRLIKLISTTSFKRTPVIANDTDYLRRMGVYLEPGAKYFEEIIPGKWFIPNCVDTDFFQRTKPAPQLSNQRVILLPRNIRYERGIHIAIEAFAQVVKKYADLSLVIVGSTWVRAYEEYCRKRIRDLGIENNVIFWGRAGRELMPSLYSSAILNLVPSLLTEGTSLSALEGMSCGVPTITSDVGGLKDIPCVHFPEGDTAELADRMLSLLGDGRTWERTAQAQENQVRTLFNLKNWTEAWRNAVTSVLSN